MAHIGHDCVCLQCGKSRLHPPAQCTKSATHTDDTLWRVHFWLNGETITLFPTYLAVQVRYFQIDFIQMFVYKLDQRLKTWVSKIVNLIFSTKHTFCSGNLDDTKLLYPLEPPIPALNPSACRTVWKTDTTQVQTEGSKLCFPSPTVVVPAPAVSRLSCLYWQFLGL